MFNGVVLQLAHHTEHQDGSAHVRHSDVSDQSGSIAKTTHVPNVVCPQSNANSLSFADGDEDLKGIENHQLGQAPSS